jgi:hypothetical protein
MENSTPAPTDCFICGEVIEGEERTVLAMQEHATFSRTNVGPFRHEVLFAHRQCALRVAHTAFAHRLRAE